MLRPLGTWWVNSGADFAPQDTVPVRAGGFVRRVARTPHYDGVKKGEKEPAVIGIFGEGPIDLRLSDPSKLPVREVWLTREISKSRPIRWPKP